jgi:DNA-binding XRE family transcriptional regulator
MEYIAKPPLSELVDELYHYGVKRRSGRYPWGSGKEPYQHSGDFLSRVEELKRQGLKETEIARVMGFIDPKTGRTQSQKLRTQVELAKHERRDLKRETAMSLKEKGYNVSEIARQMGYKNESSVRSLLNEDTAIRKNQAKATAEILKKMVDEKGMIDVGKGVERELGISSEKMKQALYILEMEGYPTYGGRMEQATNKGKMTTMSVLCPPGTPHKDIFKNPDKIETVVDYISKDGGATFEPRFTYPSSLNSKRLKINYKEDGGIDKDGLIELRRGVDDLDLGGSRISQVRILVDGTHYIKGMAIYSDNMPDGVDVVFNTNKKRGTPVKDVLKKIKDDPENPFGSNIKDAELGGQYWYIDKNGKKKLGLINKRADEGDWSEWKDKVPSQFLSKQPHHLAKQQLKLAIDDKKMEFEEICALTNPTVKKRLLQSFSDDCDSAAVHLQAAAFPRQKYHVIIPIPTMKDNEVYAPKYENGERVALVRYPHGGTFEIPILTVNNKQINAKKALGNTIDAIGINSKVAERLSGADFDGDTVMVIPTSGKVKITSTPALEKLKGFDPKMEYGTIKKTDGYYNSSGKKVKIMSESFKQKQMGIASNLITDMTLKGANDDEKARAVRHSMVVIDAVKHHLDYQKSYVENGIAALKKKYQGHYDDDGKYHEGASTLISRAKSPTQVDKRQGTPKINIKGAPYYDPTKPEGAYVYKSADNLEYQVKQTSKTGKVSYVTKTRTEEVSKMSNTDDARTLISSKNTPMERLYADYANTMKAMANQARKEMVSTGKIKYSKTAKTAYQKEVVSLNEQLKEVMKMKPRERKAQLMTNAEVNAKKQSNPNMTKDEEKKLKQQTLNKYRDAVGAKRIAIDITDKQWEAIQAGAISESILKQILDNTDIDAIRERATPRVRKELSPAKLSKIKQMNSMGYTQAEIAKAVGVSTSTVSNYIKPKKERSKYLWQTNVY